MSDPQAIHPFIRIAHEEGSLMSVWGPCTGTEDPTPDRCTCPQCDHAQAIEDAGLDFNEEYEKARQRAK